MTQSSKTEIAILKTLCWFDVFDYPLTKEEVWRFGLFIDECELGEVEKELAKMMIGNKIIQTEIFFHLPGRSEIITERKKRYNHTDQKFKRAMKFAKIFRLLPSIELVAMGNLIGSHNLRAGGDIDLLIVAKPGTIWTTRFITATIVKLLGARPTADSTTDKICLSFYATSEALNFESTAQVNQLYFFYWLAFLTPIYDPHDAELCGAQRGGAYAKLMRENIWIKERLPNFFPQTPHHLRTVKKINCYLADLILYPWYLFENQLKSLQLKILPQSLRELANQDTRVVISDRMLKFHANDRRQEFQEKYRTKLRQYNVE